MKIYACTYRVAHEELATSRNAGELMAIVVNQLWAQALSEVSFALIVSHNLHIHGIGGMYTDFSLVLKVKN